METPPTRKKGGGAPAISAGDKDKQLSGRKHAHGKGARDNDLSPVKVAGSLSLLGTTATRTFSLAWPCSSNSLPYTPSFTPDE